MTDHSVFVIDDDQAMRDSLLMLLRGEGIRARGFASAMQFLEQLPDDKSAAPAMPGGMGGMGGMDF